VVARRASVCTTGSAGFFFSEGLETLEGWFEGGEGKVSGSFGTPVPFPDARMLAYF
jgi:hypothetical protein